MSFLIFLSNDDEAAVLGGVCRFTPGLSWIERTYRQASKHLHAADAADIAVLMGAWGELGYTPRDRLYMNQVRQHSCTHLFETKHARRA